MSTYQLYVVVISYMICKFGAGNMVSNCCINMWPGRSKLAHPPRVWWGPGFPRKQNELRRKSCKSKKKHQEIWNVRTFAPQKFFYSDQRNAVFTLCEGFFPRSTPWILNDSYVESGNLDFVWWMAPADKHCNVCRKCTHWTWSRCHMIVLFTSGFGGLYGSMIFHFCQTQRRSWTFHHPHFVRWATKGYVNQNACISGWLRLVYK